jgi:hypothetical protein
MLLDGHYITKKLVPKSLCTSTQIRELIQTITITIHDFLKGSS